MTVGLHVQLEVMKCPTQQQTVLHSCARQLIIITIMTIIAITTLAIILIIVISSG